MVARSPLSGGGRRERGRSFHFSSDARLYCEMLGQLVPLRSQNYVILLERQDRNTRTRSQGGTSVRPHIRSDVNQKARVVWGTGGPLGTGRHGGGRALSGCGGSRGASPKGARGRSSECRLLSGKNTGDGDSFPWSPTSRDCPLCARHGVGAEGRGKTVASPLGTMAGWRGRDQLVYGVGSGSQRVAASFQPVALRPQEVPVSPRSLLPRL